jgi:DNA topoisomerase IB
LHGARHPRRRRGRGFEYLDPDAERIDDPEALERIRELAIPPAWREVWVCLDPLGHLQATGVDAAGRKQYLCHPRWRAHRGRQKFEHMLESAIALPGLRRRVPRDIGLPKSRASSLSIEGLNRRRVTACAVRLLDLGFFRIGSEQHAKQNESFGLTTILREHVRLSDGELIFDFPAKSGQPLGHRRARERVESDVIELLDRAAG